MFQIKISSLDSNNGPSLKEGIILHSVKMSSMLDNCIKISMMKFTNKLQRPLLTSANNSVGQKDQTNLELNSSSFIEDVEQISNVGNQSENNKEKEEEEDASRILNDNNNSDDNDTYQRIMLICKATLQLNDKNNLKWVGIHSLIVTAHEGAGKTYLLNKVENSLNKIKNADSNPNINLNTNFRSYSDNKNIFVIKLNEPRARIYRQALMTRTINTII